MLTAGGVGGRAVLFLVPKKQAKGEKLEENWLMAIASGRACDVCMVACVMVRGQSSWLTVCLSSINNTCKLLKTFKTKQSFTFLKHFLENAWPSNYIEKTEQKFSVCMSCEKVTALHSNSSTEGWVHAGFRCLRCIPAQTLPVTAEELLLLSVKKPCRTKALTDSLVTGDCCLIGMALQWFFSFLSVLIARGKEADTQAKFIFAFTSP